MRRFIILLSALFCINAIAHTTDWYVDEILYQSTTCTPGDNITPPNPPSKPGYHFVDWIPYYVPSEYTKLEYIDTDGESWIDTGITPTATTLQFDYKMQILQQEYVSLFGAVAATAPRYGFRVYYQPAGGTTNQLNWQSGSFVEPQYVTWNDVLQGTVIATQGVSVFSTINGTTKTYSSSAIDLTQSDTMFLGTTHLGTTSGRAPTRIWSFKITKDGTVVRDFVPAKRNSDNVVGMYDTVSKRFFTNAGTGVFIAGPGVH